MRMTVAELRSFMRRTLQERWPDVRKSDIFGTVDFDVRKNAFFDRYGKEIQGPESMSLPDVKSWLDSNRVEEIRSMGRKFSPRTFIPFLTYLQTGTRPQPKPRPTETQIPIIKGKPIE